MTQACERFALNPDAALWDVPASLLLMMIRQPGPGWTKGGFGTAELETFNNVDLSDFDQPYDTDNGS